ncbi:hypothetical protein [Streptomyces sp. NPDC126503]|uniref:SCO7613 C-terminal domain-containing membrane protein n=1 Tax=Streptomyces sp. NPDC126503 TaxID=3155315 RepID=UPI003326BA48
MNNTLPPADELVLIDRELARLDERRAQLLARRAWLVQALSRPVAAPAAPFRPPHVPGAEASPRGAQNVLLTLGGTLLTSAAIAFTLVSWGSMGIGGRAAVLALVTTAALAAPVPLLRRGLVSTAESVAALGLVLMVLDAYALHRVALPGTDGLGYAAAASAVLAGAWAAYGSALTRLRIPLPAAVAAAQLPLPLGVLAAGGGVAAFAWAALVTAVVDTAVVLRTRPPAVRATAGAGGAALGAWALLTGGWLSLASPWTAAPLLLAAAVLCLYVARSAPAVAVAVAGLGGLSVLAATGGLLRAALPDDWAVPAYVLCALPLAALRRPGPPVAPAARGAWATWGAPAGSAGAPAWGPGTDPERARAATPDRRPEAPEWPGTGDGAGTRAGAEGAGTTGAGGGSAGADSPSAGWLPAAVRTGLAGAGALVSALGVLWALPPVAAGLLEPLARTTGVWSGRHAERALAPYPATAALVLLLVGAALAALPRLWARGGALALGWALLTALPVVLGLPYAGTLAVQLASTTAALALAVRPALLTRGLLTAGAPEAANVLGWLGFTAGCASGVSALGLALDTRGATFTVLGLLLALLTGVAVLDTGARRTAAAVGGVLAATGLVLATAASADLGRHHTALALLLVPAGTAALGAKARPVALAVEPTGAAVGLLAVGFAVSRPAYLALVLALGGVIALATALRPERRRFASWAAAGLALAAVWVRLAAWEVTTPEAYTLPVTVPALVVGLLRRRRDPEASSWTAYGPGLAVTFLPGLVAVWTDPVWIRPLVLGVAALGVTLLGARFRLRAPLLLGGGTLALVGLHELAPYVVQVVGALPRWLPPALAGLLLLGVGATYEHRLRDARRLRERFSRMR